MRENLRPCEAITPIVSIENENRIGPLVDRHSLSLLLNAPFQPRRRMFWRHNGPRRALPRLAPEVRRVRDARHLTVVIDTSDREELVLSARILRRLQRNSEPLA